MYSVGYQELEMIKLLNADSIPPWEASSGEAQPK